MSGLVRLKIRAASALKIVSVSLIIRYDFVSVLHTETTDFVYMVYDVAMFVCRNIALSPASEATFHCHFNLLIKYEERTKKSILLRAFQFYNEQHVDAVRYFYWQKKENHF